MADGFKTYNLRDYPSLATFLQQEPVAVIAVPVDSDGTLHAATLHYWNSESPLAFYFVTNRDSEKCRLLKTQPEISCACVVGMQKSTEFTLQMRGKLREAPDPTLFDGYYRKQNKQRPDAAIDPKNMYLVFTPDWARFTDYKAGYERYFLELPK